MIRNFRHKGLRLLWEYGDGSKLPANLISKIVFRLEAIDMAIKIPEDLQRYAGMKVHKLIGNYKDYWSVWVSASHRIIFKWDGVDAYDIDYLNYH